MHANSLVYCIEWSQSLIFFDAIKNLARFSGVILQEYVGIMQVL